jgi:glycosyltransferase involved in cell wall biosynthesis
MVTADNGWIIPEGDGAALGRAVDKAVADRSGLKKKGAASRRMAQERFNLESMAESFLGAVRSVAGAEQ